MQIGFIHYINFLFLVLAGSIELRTFVPPVLPEIFFLNMLLKSAEMNIQFMEVF